MRILIVSDAGTPQVNGVVSTLTQTAAWLRRFGHEVQLLTPAEFRTVACPTYPEIRLVLGAHDGIRRLIRQFRPHAIHIATEGPLGLAARRHCRRSGLKFTTSYHTQFPQYIRARFPVPLPMSYFILRWFHGAAHCCMVSTRAVHEELRSRGFKNLTRWGRGVDTERFRPREVSLLDLPRPIAAYAGRLSVEKNVAAFLRMPWSGSKVVIGDGPDRVALQAAHPGAHFLGFRFGDEFANLMASADVFVFPSRTDTFGLVLLESLACGVPVAAYSSDGSNRCDRGWSHGRTGCGFAHCVDTGFVARTCGVPSTCSALQLGSQHPSIREQSGAV